MLFISFFWMLWIKKLYFIWTKNTFNLQVDIAFFLFDQTTHLHIELTKTLRKWKNWLQQK